MNHNFIFWSVYLWIWICYVFYDHFFCLFHNHSYGLGPFLSRDLSLSPFPYRNTYFYLPYYLSTDDLTFPFYPPVCRLYPPVYLTNLFRTCNPFPYSNDQNIEPFPFPFLSCTTIYLYNPDNYPYYCEKTYPTSLGYLDPFDLCDLPSDNLFDLCICPNGSVTLFPSRIISFL